MNRLERFLWEEGNIKEISKERSRASGSTKGVTIALLAGAFAVGFLGGVFAMQWPFSAFLLSDAADNRFFARSGHWPYFAQPGDWMNRFWDFDHDPITFKGIALAFLRAFSSARLGLWLGNYLLRLKR